MVASAAAHALYSVQAYRNFKSLAPLFRLW
ncbi:hypothetical protein ACVWXO_009704 [Bradyrhizobium sp. LM2.7]